MRSPELPLLVVLGNALGIAGSYSGGLIEFSRCQNGAMIKRLHLGKAAEGGVTAALLASRGFAGPESVLEGKFGFCRTFSDSPKLPYLTRRLGTEFETLNICIKRCACHINAHAPIEALQKLREQLAEDIEFFRELATFLTEHTSAGSRVDLIGVVQQVERALVDELDYRTEARNAAAFRKSLATFPHILIPRVIDAYTTHKVLTTERIRGVKIDDIPPISRIEYDFSVLAEEFSHAYLQQITDSGHFHADPHPGNVFIVLPGRENPRTPAEAVADDRRQEVRPGATPLTQSENEAKALAAPAAPRDDPKLALIDFGMTAHLTGTMRDRVVRLLLAMGENNGDAVAEALIEIGEVPEEFDRAPFVRDVAALIANHATQTVEETPAGVMLYEVITIAYRSGLKLPGELTLLAKALFNLDAVARALDPSFNPSQSIREYTAEIANKRAQRDLSPRRLFQMAAETSDLVRALPHRIDMITQKLVADDFAVRVDTPQLGSLLLGLEKVANRIFTGLVLGGLLVASGLLMAYQRSLGMIGFLLAGIIGLWMIATIFIQDRRSRKRKGKS